MTLWPQGLLWQSAKSSDLWQPRCSTQEPCAPFSLPEGEVKVLLTDPHAPGRCLSAQIACMAHARLRRPALHVVAKGVLSHATLQALSLEAGVRIAGRMAAWKASSSCRACCRAYGLHQADKDGGYLRHM